MGGGIIQLVAIGKQDIFLTSDPQVTYFKIVYRRHTNFSTEMIKQNFTKDPNFGTKTTCFLSQAGDLIRKIYFVVDLPLLPKIVDNEGNKDTLTKVAWVRRLGYAMIRFVEIEIGSQLVDKQFGEWMHIWSELTVNDDKLRGLSQMIGDRDELISFSNGKNSFRLYIPLQFWFCRNTGLALPISALQYSDVKINIELRDLNECIITTPTHYIQLENGLVDYKPFEYITQNVDGVEANGIFVSYDFTNRRLYYIRVSRNPFLGTASTTSDPFNNTTLDKFKIIGESSKYEGLPAAGVVEHPHRFNNRQLNSIFIKSAFLLVEYVFLDIEERLRFAGEKHEYQIDVLSYDGEKQVDSSSQRLRLGLNHPTRELFFVAQFDFLQDTRINDHFNYTDNFRRGIKNTFFGSTFGDPIGKNLVNIATVVFNGQERLGIRDAEYFNWIQSYQHHTKSQKEGINIYSFSLFPEKYQASGAANLSRIDEVTLQIRLNNKVNQNNIAKMRVYALNWNRLRIANGLGGLVFTE
ncbi:MAG: hypothetical protein CMF62_00190 [Magnetococcales bacterium]|nr:hypothetical protein [Magnetococcales bacterium]|tara:strand:- start:7910 stop:9475 length:1566 start_codon:yes stop_codon:yes gene_type:complete